ncbi:MAG: hypothetical protein EAY75_00430 [Bacteroidetes bacterium]|nr:MAG: hypothetical protein EAY75_00430 [Bacteroidota bacterium]
MAEQQYIYQQADIVRYLQGKMTPAEAHAIERAALDSPLLQDAIEGYDLAMQSHDASHLLHQVEAVTQRVNAVGKPAEQVPPIRMLPWRRLAYAAAACTVLAAVWWLFKLTQTPITAPRELAQQTMVADSSTNTVANGLESLPEPRSLSKASVETATADAKTETKAVTQLPQAATQNLESALASSGATASNTTTIDTEYKNKALQSAEPRQQADISQAKEKREYDAKLNRESAVQSTANAPLNANNRNGLVITGKVTNQENYPLDGVQITVRETGKSITTDALGRFNVEAADTQVTVVASAAGFDTKTVKLSSNTLSNNIALQSNLDKLDEVVVIGYAAKKKGANAPKSKAPALEMDTTDAVPIVGWADYEKYLYGKKQQLRQLEKKATSKVTLSFEINAMGRPENFYIIQSAGSEVDKKAIQLVKDGPQWKPKSSLPAFAKLTLLF